MFPSPRPSLGTGDGAGAPQLSTGLQLAASLRSIGKEALSKEHQGSREGSRQLPTGSSSALVSDLGEKQEQSGKNGQIVSLLVHTAPGNK